MDILEGEQHRPLRGQRLDVAPQRRQRHFFPLLRGHIGLPLPLAHRQREEIGDKRCLVRIRRASRKQILQS